MGSLLDPLVGDEAGLERRGAARGVAARVPAEKEVEERAGVPDQPREARAGPLPRSVNDLDRCLLDRMVADAGLTRLSAEALDVTRAAVANVLRRVDTRRPAERARARVVARRARVGVGLLRRPVRRSVRHRRARRARGQHGEAREPSVHVGRQRHARQRIQSMRRKRLWLPLGRHPRTSSATRCASPGPHRHGTATSSTPWSLEPGASFRPSLPP